MSTYIWVDTNTTKFFFHKSYFYPVINIYLTRWCQMLCVTYIDVRDVCVLVDVHVGDLVTGVWPQGAVTRLAGAGARAEAGGQEAGVLVRGAREAGAARPAGQQPPRGHGVWPPGPEVRVGRGRGGGQAGAAVKIRSHSRLQWVMGWVSEWAEGETKPVQCQHSSEHSGSCWWHFCTRKDYKLQRWCCFSNKIF